MKNEDFLDKMADRFADVMKNQLIESFDNLSDEQKLTLVQNGFDGNISEIAEGEKIEKMKQVLHDAEGKPEVIKKLFEDIPEDIKIMFMLCYFGMEDSDEE